MNTPITELEELHLSSESKIFLKETAKWSFFLSIIGFIGIAFMVILALFSSFIFNNIPQTQSLPFNFGVAMAIFYLIMAAIYFIPIYYLFQFSNKMKKALASKNDETLTDAFSMLKAHYKFLGVFTIILLSLYFLVFIAAMIGFLD